MADNVLDTEQPWTHIVPSAGPSVQEIILVTAQIRDVVDNKGLVPNVQLDLQACRRRPHDVAPRHPVCSEQHPAQVCVADIQVVPADASSVLSVLDTEQRESDGLVLTRGFRHVGYREVGGVGPTVARCAYGRLVVGEVEADTGDPQSVDLLTKDAAAEWDRGMAGCLQGLVVAVLHPAWVRGRGQVVDGEERVGAGSP